jgi:hypothetical protein
MRLAVVLLLAACGDNLAVSVPAEATSGDRLKLQTYRYGDGARQIDPAAAFDVVEGTSCRAQIAGTPGGVVTGIFDDDGLRCIPTGDEAVFLDAACTVAVGRARSDLFPTHFVAYDRGPVRVFRAGAPIDPPTEVFGIRDGACVGPQPVTEELQYYATRSQVPITSLARFEQTTAQGDRVEVPLLTTDDGWQVPLGIIDSTYQVVCAPQVTAGDVVPCEPIGGVPAYAYADAACTQGVAFAPAEPIPTVAVQYRFDGCPTYLGVGEIFEGDVYFTDGTTCFLGARPEDQVAFRVTDPIEVAPLARTIDAVPGRRLQRIGLVDGPLTFASATLWDTRVDAPCSATTIEGVTRCLPTRTITGRTLFGPDCTTELAFVEVPQRCEVARMARLDDEEGPRFFTIGAPITEVYYPVDGCTRYPVTPGFELRALGPAMRLADFETGVYAGER